MTADFRSVTEKDLNSDKKHVFGRKGSTVSNKVVSTKLSGKNTRQEKADKARYSDSKAFAPYC